MQCLEQCFGAPGKLILHRGQIAKGLEERADTHHHEGAVERSDVVGTRTGAMPLEPDDEPDCEQRVAQHDAGQVTGIHGILFFAHGLELPGGLAQHGEFLRRKVVHIGLGGTQRLFEYAHSDSRVMH
jgi:hypothetical protein